VLPLALKFIVPALWAICVALYWFSIYEPYIGLDMPPLKLRNYSVIGGDAKIAPSKKHTEMSELESDFGGIPHPPNPLKVPHQGGVIWTLWAKEMYLFAFIESGFLVIFPAMKFLSMFLVFVIPMPPWLFVRMVKVQRFIGKWAMLDVFVLGT
jgi:hypothetical protein